MTHPDLEGPRIPGAMRQAGCGRGAAHYLDSAAAFLSGCVAQVPSLREIDILHLPEELGCNCPAEPRALLLWVPAPLDD